MAVLTLSALTKIRAWEEGGPANKDRKVWYGTVVTDASPGNGGATDNIPATLFGMTVIEEVAVAVQDDGRLLLAAPSYDGSLLQLYEVETATDGNRGDPVNFISTTFKVLLRGY